MDEAIDEDRIDAALPLLRAAAARILGGCNKREVWTSGGVLPCPLAEPVPARGAVSELPAADRGDEGSGSTLKPVVAERGFEGGGATLGPFAVVADVLDGLAASPVGCDRSPTMAPPSRAGAAEASVDTALEQPASATTPIEIMEEQEPSVVCLQTEHEWFEELSSPLPAAEAQDGVFPAHGDSLPSAERTPETGDSARCLPQPVQNDGREPSASCPSPPSDGGGGTTPLFLARFDAAWIDAELATMYNSHLEKKKEYEQSCALLRALLGGSACPARRCALSFPCAARRLCTVSL